MYRVKDIPQSEMSQGIKSRTGGRVCRTKAKNHSGNKSSNDSGYQGHRMLIDPQC